MNSTLMCLGQFVFGIQSLPYDELKRVTAWRHPSNSRVGARAARQFVGVGDDSITLSGWIAPELMGTYWSIAAPDIITIRARAADLGGEIRKRTEKSWHDTSLGAILATLAKRNKLTHKVDAKLGATQVQHIDQTNESDMHFITRLARKYDAVATVKKKHLLFMPINGTKTSKGESLPIIEITRIDGDQHRWASSTRDAYDGVKALWNDRKFGKRKEVIAGKKDGNLKTMKETFGSEDDALAAAKSELQRINRGMATFDLNLAIGVPELMPQTPVRVTGFKPEIDGQGWLVKEVTHTLGDGGLTSKVQMERAATEDAST
ncbi:contractile injection system protein, VgrG/Pvc8 family [Comamonas testosteroni]|uniref:contractile injection system protein, VgrG/Pvc8 family n=1 Tax=Comamonas testosteroni TaxID=285 RepID=UPI0009BF56FE|nr:contractile injection system protein, VgrG/Pvc8 family [Comamonas testosteroni]